MILASWNVRGVNEDPKHKEVRSLISRNKLSMLGLNETRTQCFKHQSIIHLLCPTWRYLSNYNRHPNGRIWVMWDPAVLDVTLLAYSDQVIHVQVLDIQNQSIFKVSFIYGHNDYILRRELWAFLRACSSTIGDVPWLVLGDFNIVRYGEEKFGGVTSSPNYMDELNACCFEAGLEDLKYSGNFLTWSRGSGQSFVARKLDRALVNLSWMTRFPEAEACFLEPGASDHSPILVQTGMHIHIRKPPFRFFNFWMDNPGFSDLVSQVWSSTLAGSPQYILSQKLKELKQALKTYNKQHHSNLFNRVEEARDHLFHIQKLLVRSPGDELLKQ